jgi:NADH-quinone oxidoreductase subunit M
MDNSQILLVTVLLPLIGAILMGPCSRAGDQVARGVALLVTCVTLLFASMVIHRFPADGGSGQAFAVFDYAWFVGGDAAKAAAPRIQFNIGLDGLSVWLFGLSALLMVSAVLISWTAIRDRVGLFYGMLLLLESGCLGVFVARDILLFYVFFEFTLIPLFFLVGIWGSEDRRYAAMKFFLFTLAGSVLTFLGILSLVLWDQQHSGTGQMRFMIDELTAGLRAHPLPPGLQSLVFLALFAGFAIKVPLFPLHTWLPLAHVQAPTAGSVILAGVLLKIGTYGYLRFSIPMLPDASRSWAPWMLWLAAIGIIYGALVALVQSDIKRLIAYSSVSHLGFCMLGLFAFNRPGVQGGTLQMINHGLSTGGLFAIVGLIYERYHTREIRDLSGLARRLPMLACCMLLFTFSSIGLPGLNGFAGEFLILLGMFQRAYSESAFAYQGQMLAIAVISVGGVVLGAWYMLWLVQRIFFGPLREPVPHESGPGGGTLPGTDSGHSPAVRDLSPRELLALAPLLVFVVWIGLQPGYFLNRMGPTLNRLTDAARAPSPIVRFQEDPTVIQFAAGQISTGK